MRRHNIHTHSSYSDGENSPEEMMEAAKQQRLEIIGICDHAFTTRLPGIFTITSSLEEYLSRLISLQNDITGIELKIGIEIDASKRLGISPLELPFEVLNRFDYILFEGVNTKDEYTVPATSRDISEIVGIRRQLKNPVGLAHNDLQKNFEGKEEEIAKVLSQNDIFIDLNQSEAGRNTRGGLDYYRHFSKKLIHNLLLKNVKFMVGTDSHYKGGVGAVDGAYQFIAENKLLYHEMVR